VDKQLRSMAQFVLLEAKEKAQELRAKVSPRTQAEENFQSHPIPSATTNARRLIALARAAPSSLRRPPLSSFRRAGRLRRRAGAPERRPRRQGQAR
jgi:hypothetical protein